MDFKTAVLYLAIGYLIIINLAAFFAFGLDKRKARRSVTRIPESTLFCLAWVGGGIGAWGSMYAFRHKTKHKSFVFGIPAILFGEVLLIALYFIFIL